MSEKRPQRTIKYYAKHFLMSAIENARLRGDWIIEDESWNDDELRRLSDEIDKQLGRIESFLDIKTVY